MLVVKHGSAFMVMEFRDRHRRSLLFVGHAACAVRHQALQRSHIIMLRKVATIAHAMTLLSG